MPVLVLVLFAIDAALLGAHLLDPPLPDWLATERGESGDLWDLTLETSLPTWYGSMQLALIGALMLGLAWFCRRVGQPGWWALLFAGLLFAGLSADEALSFHEKFARWIEPQLGTREDTGLRRTGPWPVFVAPAFVAAMVVIGIGARHLLRSRARIAWLYAAGLAIFVASFAGVELLSNFVRDFRRVATIEETGELVGTTVILWATAELARSLAQPWISPPEGGASEISRSPPPA